MLADATPSAGAAAGAITGAQYTAADTSVWIASVARRGGTTLSDFF